MDRSERPLTGYARRGWVAFCSGWWLAGVVLGFRHFLDLVARPSPNVLEAVGVSVLMGGLLPGATPFWYAADVVGAQGLPVGFTGLVLGAVLALVVWVTLPVALSIDDHLEHDETASRAFRVVAAVPYLAAVAGLIHLFYSFDEAGQAKLRAGSLAFAAAAIAYLLGAGALFTVGVVFLG